MDLFSLKNAYQFIQCITHCFPNLLARGLPFSKINQGFSHPCSRQHGVGGWYIYKIRHLYLRTDFGEIWIYRSNTCNIALRCMIWT